MSYDLVWIMLLRLAVAGMLGTLIGLEREYRAKEAGMRTHFLVALGSCLIMIVSQYGFGDNYADASRVAAQIVSGIGFLGAGIIIFRKEAVQGLTTAAGLWVSAGIGMAVGGGMYILGVASTVLTLICFEVLRFSSAHLGLVRRSVHVTFAVKSESALEKAMHNLRSKGFYPGKYSFFKEQDGGLKVSVEIRYRSRRISDGDVLHRLEKVSGLKVQRFE